MQSVQIDPGIAAQIRFLKRFRIWKEHVLADTVEAEGLSDFARWKSHAVWCGPVVVPFNVTRVTVISPPADQSWSWGRGAGLFFALTARARVIDCKDLARSQCAIENFHFVQQPVKEAGCAAIKYRCAKIEWRCVRNDSCACRRGGNRDAIDVQGGRRAIISSGQMVPLTVGDSRRRVQEITVRVVRRRNLPADGAVRFERKIVGVIVGSSQVVILANQSPDVSGARGLDQSRHS